MMEKRETAEVTIGYELGRVSRGRRTLDSVQGRN